MKYVYSLLGLALLVCLLPVILPVAALAVTSLAGCNLDEGGAYSCMILGVDWGETLNVMFVAHWLGLITLPFAGLALLALALTAVIDFVRRRFRRAKHKD